MSAHATISCNTKIGNVGGLGASCIEDYFQSSISYASAPGIGVTSAYNITSWDVAIQKACRESPNFIINYFQANKVITFEQHAIMSCDSKDFTGLDSDLWAGAMAGDVNSFDYSFQGNSLTSANVGFQAIHAFEDADFKETVGAIEQGCEMA